VAFSLPKSVFRCPSRGFGRGSRRRLEADRGRAERVCGFFEGLSPMKSGARSGGVAAEGSKSRSSTNRYASMPRAKACGRSPAT